MGFLSVQSMAHRWVAERAGPGDTVIDATAGNGVDTLFLAQTVGSTGSVFAFDVQEAALERTRERIAGSAGAGTLAPVTLLHAGHEKMRELVPSSLHGYVRAVMFNLGYLPGADESLITVTGTTLPALDAALTLLAPGGVLTGGIVSRTFRRRRGSGCHGQLGRRRSRHARSNRGLPLRAKRSAPFLVALEKR